MTDQPLTLTDAAAQLRDGSTTSVELLRAASARADAHDDVLGAYLIRFDEQALAAAERADAELAAGVDHGPLHGIPIGVKDILAMSEGPTTAQSLVLDPAWGVGKDAPVVARLKAAGAVLTGKLSTMEFAIGMPDPSKPFPLPRNPWDPATWPGGSSSGSGGAVASGMVLAGVGTDTAGSIRIPAVYCGVSGLMPTYGRVPKSGCVPLGYSLDHIGPLARSARDCGAFLQAIAGPDPTDVSTQDRPVPDFCATADGRLDGVRVGVERAHHLKEGDDPALEAAFELAVGHLEALGAVVSEVVIPHYDEACVAQWVTMVCEALAYHQGDLGSRWEDYFAFTRTTVAGGALYSGADVVQAQRVRRVAQRGLAALFTDVDVIATPATATGAPTYDTLLSGSVSDVMGGIHTAYWDAVGNPALVVPMGFTDGGLPLSLQLAARPFEEALLIRAGDAFQQATDWHLRVPPLVTESSVAA
ncbi:amidase [Patulibacter sp. NPDC049589]|uniref:amidase n=1 Tax=Patulibacter sp. NPDC049589 TaxID=3154731 RepID=UPI00344063B8